MAEIIELFPKKEEKKTNIFIKIGIVDGKTELWEQLPVEWRTSPKGIQLGHAILAEREELQALLEAKIEQNEREIQENNKRIDAYRKTVFKTYSEDLIQDDAEWLELLAKRCDVALDKQPDSRGLKLLRGRMRNWLKQYQIYQQQGGDNAELHEKYKDIHPSHLLRMLAILEIHPLSGKLRWPQHPQQLSKLLRRSMLMMAWHRKHRQAIMSRTVHSMKKAI